MSKHPKKSREADIREDWLGYLLQQLETAIERDAAQWDVASVKAAQQRVEKIATRLGGIAITLEA